MSLRKLLWVFVITGILLGAAYIMVNGIGLADSLDFGAGAYYYADMPEFDRFGSSVDFGDSTLAVIAFFIVWSIVVIGLLRLVRSIPMPSEEPVIEEKSAFEKEDRGKA